MKKLLTITAIAVGLSVHAFTHSDNHFWVGPDYGTNQCSIVIDWGTTAKSWGFKWSGSMTVFEAVRRVVHEDNRLEFRAQSMAGYTDIYFFGYDVSDTHCMWEFDYGAASCPLALCDSEDKKSFTKWWVFYEVLSSTEFPTDPQFSSMSSVCTAELKNNSFYVFRIGSPDYDVDWNESPTALTVPVPAESPYGYASSQSQCIGRPASYRGTLPVTPDKPALSESYYSIPEQGSVVVEFDHKVMDDPNNPFGMDFIVFGNSRASTKVDYEDSVAPSSRKFTGKDNAEKAKVEVSQDGVTWYSYLMPAYGDSFAPTLGFTFEPNDLDTTIENNKYWGLPADATRPLYPYMSISQWANQDLKTVAYWYNHSAGGTPFDLNNFIGLPRDENGKLWCKFVRCSSMNYGGTWTTPEIDAVSDVSPVSGYDLWLFDNYHFMEIAQPEIAGKTAISPNGRSNLENYILGRMATEEVPEDDPGLSIKSFEPHEDYHLVFVETCQPLTSSSGILVKQTATLGGEWNSTIPEVISNTEIESGYLNTLKVPNKGSFLKLVVEE